MESVVYDLIMKLINLLGQKFGKLTVVELIKGSRDGSKLWLCKCECGNLKQVTTRHLNRANHNVRSCGCDRFRSGKNHHQWTGTGEISGDWWSTHVVRQSSSTARIKVPLTIDINYAWELFLIQEKKCALSGVPLKFSKKGDENSASLDRIDSSQGYIQGNVQWVHKHVNFMKRNYDQNYFIEFCKKIVNNIKIKENK